LFWDVCESFSVITAKSERLMFRNDRKIEVRVCKDRITIVRKNDFFEEGRAMSSGKKSVNIGKPPQRPINSFNGWEKHDDITCSLVCEWHKF
jgi:hypothetical protein